MKKSKLSEKERIKVKELIDILSVLDQKKM